ncbi:AimR family lysis-lysogeny pheromone receptor [Bacillus atrophaeus]|uniref:AimR family lysis-lysogeny pheromone receptor n=1 Tax=Bacillus atrophaeus TaxID=1452 RepID=UPI00227FB472|nr:AimR family lysis-lysogeny pheromone receptor [Bacillus atrophaeus]MCY8517899.1 AimR family lysis-lysogeny pheromone receptor [Bacillus atrophaeus]
MKESCFDARGHLKQIIESKEEKQKEIADKIGISASHLSKFLNGKEISFWMILEITRYLDRENEIKIMKQFCKEATKKNIKSAFEYAHLKKLSSEIKYLIDRVVNGNNRELKEWSMVYEWQLKITAAGYYSEYEYLDRIRGLNPSSHEMKTLVLILEMLCFYSSKKFDLAKDYLEKIDKCLINIDDPFLKRAFKSRTSQALANILLKYEENIGEARLIAKEMIDLNLGVESVTNGYFILSLSYWYESFEESSQYFKKAIELNDYPERKYVAEDLREQLSILELYWYKELSELSLRSDFIKKVLSKEDLNIFYDNEYYRPYALYFNGVRKESKEDLLLSLHFFSNQNDNFRSNMPKKELMKKGSDYNILKRR